MLRVVVTVWLCLLCAVSGFRPLTTSFRASQGLRSASRLQMEMAVKVGIVGATGAVGEEILKVMEDRVFPASSLTLFVSEKSAGKVVKSSRFGDITLKHSASKRRATRVASGCGRRLFLEWAEKLAEAGVLVIDNSSAFRMKEECLWSFLRSILCIQGKKLIANPNCTTAIALMALWPIC